MPFNDQADLKALSVTKETPPALVPDQDIDTLINRISVNATGTNKMSDDEISVGLAIILQKGGTAKRAQPNISANVNGKTLELGAVRKAMTDINFKYTLRQVARTKANFIFQVALNFDINGDLAQKLGMKDPSLSKEELLWMSNFQMNNPQCPEKVRKLLMDHFNDLFIQKP